MCKGKTLYIAYGSNLNIEQMAVRCPTAKVVGSTTLKDYQLLFRGFNGGAVATVEKKPGSSVPVLIWELEPSDEAALDRYEGYPVFYRKEYIKVRLNGKQVQAMIYIMNEVMNEGRPLGTPGRRYYNTILEGYQAAGFDTGVLNKAVQASARHED